MTSRPVLADLCSPPGDRRLLCALPSLAALLLALGTTALAQAQAGTAPSGAETAGSQAESLRAVFIDVNGKVQWRPSEADAWRNAAVNDVVLPGSEVRTGTRSHAALRIGRNATALIDAGTRFQIPVAVQEGDVLRTTVAVKQGRADFKVDKVGLSNDFKVVTPSTTLAVRGTGFAVATGALKQVEVLGARRNAINAIELKYALSNTTVQMSGGASSSSSVQQPAHSAMVSTSSPATAGALPTTSSTEAVVQAAVGQSPANAGSAASSQQSNNSSAKSQNSVAKVTDAKTDGDGIVAVINRALIQQGADAVAEADGAVADARALVEQRIELLLTDLGEEELLAANQDALAALRALAEARRDAARDALARHDAARSEAAAAESAAAARHQAFDARAGELVTQLGVFDADRTAALDALSAIRRFIDEERGEGSSPDGSEGVLASVRQASDRLVSMGAGLSAGLGSLEAMDREIEGIGSILSELDEGARGRAHDAIAAYRAAMRDLARAVSVGDDAESIARAARDTVAGLELVVASLAEARSAPELLAHAESAAALLRAASADLDRALLARNAVRAAREEAGNDPRKSYFGEVEQTYGRIVQLRAQLVARWLGADGEVSLRDSRLASALSEAESTFASLSGLATDESAQRRADAQSALAAAQAAHADAVAARDVEEESAVQDASAALADARSRGATAAAARVAAGEDRQAVGGHGDAVDSALSAASAAGTDAGRTSAIADARGALDSMHDALVALAGHEAAARAALSGGPGPSELAALLARAEDALDRMMSARNAASGAADGAADRADGAREIADAMQVVLDLATGLEDLYGPVYGMSAGAVRAGESASRDAAAAAEAARDAARALRDAVAAIHDGALDGNRVGALVAQVRDALDANALVGAAAAADLAAGEAAFLARGESASVGYAALAADAAARNGMLRPDSEVAASDAAAALAAHASALAGADGASQSAQALQADFDSGLVGLQAFLAQFGEHGAASTAALDAIAAFVAGGGEGGASLLGGGSPAIDDASARVNAAALALGAMADAFGGAAALRTQLDADRAAIDSLVAALGPGERSAAASAIAAYDAALARLSALASSGADARSVADAAHAAAGRLADLVSGLGQLLPSGAQLALAQRAADRLAAAAASLSEASAAHQAIEALAAQASGSSTGARLGEVEAIYGSLVQVQVATLAAFAGAEAGVATADGVLSAAVARTQSEFDALAAFGASRSADRAAEADAFAAAASQAHADAVAGRAAAEAAVTDAEALRARALARASDADAEASGATAARAEVGVHGTSVTQALSGLLVPQSHVFDLGTGNYGSGAYTTLTAGPLGGSVTGFTVSFHFSGSPGTWASDAALGINGLQWGGYNQYTLPGQAFQGNWNFYGNSSGTPGTYTDTFSGLSISTANGLTLVFGNAWFTESFVNATYANVTVELRTAGAGGYVPELASAHLASIASAADAMESMRASLDSLAGHRDALARLADRAAWDAESSALQARAAAARDALLGALAAATSSASGAGLAAADVAELADAMEGFAAIAAQLETRFGADRGFSGAAVAAGAQSSSAQQLQANLAASAAASLRDLAQVLAQGISEDGRVAAALAQVAAALDASDAHVGARFAAADAELGSGALAFRGHAVAAAEAFATYGLSARLAAGLAADGADAAALAAGPLRRMVELRSDAQARAASVTEGAAGFDAQRGEFGDARALADSGIAALPAAAAGTLGMQEAQEVKAALDRMEAALLGSLGMEANASRVSAAIADTARYQGLAALAAQATAAIDDILAARDTTASFASKADAAAGAAGAASGAAQRIAAICADLEQRFGLSGDLVRAAAQLASERSSSASDDRDRALLARNLVADLALLASASQIDQLAQQINATLAVTDGSAAGLTSAQAAALADARAQYADSNRAGAVAFGGLTGNRRDQSLLVEASGTESFGRLEGLVARFDQAVAGLDAVEADAGDALGRASGAATSAEGARDLAVGHRNDAEASFGLTVGALSADDVSGAVHHRNDAATSASAAEGEAARASGFHGDAVTARNDVIVLDAAMAARIAQFTSASAEQQDASSFTAALGAHRDSVGADAALAGTLSRQAAYFDGIAQILAGRAGVDLQGVLADSSAALVEAQRVAGELASLSGQAAAMANGASTNAGRLFGRSLAAYVADAQVEVDRAASAATAAATAALEARGFADGASAAVQQHNQGQGSAH